MGSLYALGGLMRIEAKNFLETKKKYDPNFRIVGKLFQGNELDEQEQAFKRDLPETDVEFFQNKDGFIQILLVFVKTMTDSIRNNMCEGSTISSKLVHYFFQYGSEKEEQLDINE